MLCWTTSLRSQKRQKLYFHHEIAIGGIKLVTLKAEAEAQGMLNAWLSIFLHVLCFSLLDIVSM